MPLPQPVDDSSRSLSDQRTFRSYGRIFVCPVLSVCFYYFDRKISTTIALLLAGETATDSVLTPARIVNIVINRSLIQVPILDDLLEDAQHACTGKVYVDGFAFKSYYHVMSDAPSGDRGVVVIFQISVTDGSIQPITAGPRTTRKALDV